VIRGIDEELRAAKYANVERERRFLVDPLACPALDDARSFLIEDRYIDGSRCRLRRMTDRASGRVVTKLSKKYDVRDVLARPIVTTYLDAAEYALFAALAGHPLTKRCYPVDTAQGCFRVDVFEGPLAGLVTSEIEFPDDASGAAIVPPPWASIDVSHDPRYQGAALAHLTEAAITPLLHGACA
jgi:CYTH domain-containing protein